MNFETENDITFAIEQMAIYRGKIHDELMYAEIAKEYEKFQVRWEDSWNNPHPFDDLDAAKEYVTLYYHNHTPYINGNSYDIEEF